VTGVWAYLRVEAAFLRSQTASILHLKSLFFSASTQQTMHFSYTKIHAACSESFSQYLLQFGQILF